MLKNNPALRTFAFGARSLDGFACSRCSSSFLCFHTTSVGVDHVSERFTGGLQGSGSAEEVHARQARFKCLGGTNGTELSNPPARRRTLQRAPNHAACSITSPHPPPSPPSLFRSAGRSVPPSSLRPDSFVPCRRHARDPRSSSATCCRSCLFGAVIHPWTL